MMASARLADETVRGTGELPASAPVPRLFWPAAAGLVLIAASGANLNSDFAAGAALTLMLLGGLPHGAYDIATGRRALALDGKRALALLMAYIGIALGMAALWNLSPALALAMFLLSAAMHFGEDWAMLDTGLLRATAGASVICIPAIFHPDKVGQLFVLMGGPQGELVARLAVACAPVAILVMLTALARAILQGDREWAAAHTVAYAGLALLPPALGFTLFFVFLHSPLHMREVRHALPDWSPARFAGYGAAICAIALAGGAFLFDELLASQASGALASGFKLLSIVAAPHLLLHFAIARQAAGIRPARA